MLVLVRFLPRGALLDVAVLTILVGGSFVASNRMRDVDSAAQVSLVGAPRDWVDRSTVGDATFVYDGDLSSWSVVWQQRFWNPHLDHVVSIAPNFVPGPIEQEQVRPPGSGRLPITDRYVVANDLIGMVGVPVAHQDRGLDQYGLTLWRLTGAPRSRDRQARLPAERRHDRPCERHASTTARGGRSS